MGKQWKQKGRSAAADAKGRLFGKLAKEIMVAARAGADPAMNPALRMAVDAAKKQSMPSATLERAIKKGAGLLDGAVDYQLTTYEGFGPHQVPVIVECLTDNNTRTATNVRIAFNKGGGQLGQSGSVSWDFKRAGVIEATPPEGGEDPMEAAIEAGADEVYEDDEVDGGQVFITDAGDLSAVTRALEARGWAAASSKLAWIPNNRVTLTEEQMPEFEEFIERLDSDDDVQTIYIALEE